MSTFTTGQVLTRAELMKPDAPLTDVIESFFTANYALRPASVKWYEKYLRQFCEFIRERKHRDAVLADVDKHVVDAFLKHQATRPTRKHPNGSPFVARGSAMTLKVFANFLRKDEILAKPNGESVLTAVTIPDEPEETREPLDDAEWKQVLLASGPIGSRDRALVVFLHGTGLRQSEARLLRMRDLDLREGEVTVRAETSKFKRNRTVQFHKSVGAELDKYLRGRDRSPEATIFATDEGAFFTESGFAKVFQRIQKRSGVREFSAHVLRHTWATNFMRDGGDLLTLKRLGGWRTWTMVERYSHAIRPDREKLPDPLKRAN